LNLKPSGVGEEVEGAGECLLQQADLLVIFVQAATDNLLGDVLRLALVFGLFEVDLFFFVIPIMLLSMCLILVLILMVLGFKGLTIFPSFIKKESAIIVLVKSPMASPFIA